MFKGAADENAYNGMTHALWVMNDKSMTEDDIEHLSDIGGNAANVAMSCYLTEITSLSASRRTINAGNLIIRLNANLISATPRHGKTCV